MNGWLPPDPTLWQLIGAEPWDGTPIWVEPHGSGLVGVARFDVAEDRFVYLESGGPVRPGFDRWQPAVADQTTDTPTTGWRPIATAPKDGTRFLAWDEKDEEIEIVSWRHTDEIFPRHEPGGWPMVTQHWQPLPEAPHA